MIIILTILLPGVFIPLFVLSFSKVFLKEVKKLLLKVCEFLSALDGVSVISEFNL